MQNSVSEGAPYEPPSPIVGTAPYNSEAAATSFDSNGSSTAATETLAHSYDEVFPALPQNAAPKLNSVNHLGPQNNKMRIGSSIVTQVFVISHEESKFDLSEKFGESESVRTCHNIMQQTGATIEISSNKDQSLTFLVMGKLNAVTEAKRKILSCFQTQADVMLNIPKEHHRYLLGKGGQKLKELEKITSCKITVPNISDPSDAIKITGPKEGIEKAVHEIKVTSDEQSKQAYERISVPKVFHPFICGGHNERLNQLMQETNVRINVPPSSVQNNEITIAGEKEGVQVAKDRILAIYKEMEKRCSQVSVEVPKSQHKYVIGFKGNTIAEILQKTGVSVEMPPSDSTTDTITLRGPQDKLGFALDMVYNKANSVLATTVNCPAWLHKYVIGRKGATIKKITQDLSKGVHVEFTENKIKVEGPREEVEKAQVELEKVVNEFQNTHTFAELNVDRKFYKHIIGKGGANVNRLKEEAGVVINIGEEDSSNIIRIEGNSEGVASVKKKLQEIVTKLENEKEKIINVDHRFFPSIIGTKGDKIKEIKETYSQVQIIFLSSGERKDCVVIRGPKDEVEKCAKHLNKIVKELAEENFMLEVPIFKQFHKFVIGKGGANIKKIRDETQTKIELPSEDERSDVIRITGREENVNQAKERIQKIQGELANIVTEEITIPPKFYNSLIGPGGKLIHSISEECGGVQIKFPTTESKSDKVSIRGPKEDVERAKQQLEALKNEREAASYTVEIKAKPQHHKFLIGKNGAKIKKIRDSTGARIAFPLEKDEDKETITIIGKKEQVEQAKLELEKTIKEIDNITEAKMTVSPVHHKHFVSRRGEVIQQITNECGGTVTISFPRPNCDSDKVTLKGFKESIEMAMAKIESIVKDLESMITIECIIPQKHHRTVMGSKGTKVQNITADYKVQIKFPERDTQGDEANSQEENGTVNGEVVRPCDIIRITGKPENCQAAKEALEKLVPVTIEVPVAFDLHRSIIGKSGGNVRQLMDDFDVHIVLSPADQKLDCIKISGAPANVEKAKEALEERVRQLEKEKQDRILKSFSLTLNVDPEFHPKIIGRKGAVISEIRSKYGVQITLPKRGDPEEHIITIQGYEDKAIAARDHILRIVNELKERTKEEIEVDSRVHSRLIGQKGRSIRKLMDKYQVEIKFPRQGDPNPNLVTIIGADDNVLDAKDEILNLADDYMNDLSGSEYLQSYMRPQSFQLTLGEDRGQGDGSGEGFIVRGGPWEQQQQRAVDTTGQMDTYKQGNGSTTHFIGQDWQKLIELIENRPEESEIKSFDGGGSQSQYRAEDGVLRTLQDVKRLRQKDMALFGRCPETDSFYTVVCSLCSMILMPFALKDHWDKHHGDNKSYSPSEKQSEESPGKMKSKKLTPVKSEKADKSKKVKSSSLPETSEEMLKDSKRLEKAKKGKLVEGKPAELENSTGKGPEKGKPKGTRFAPELQPIVALSPIQVAETEAEGNENKDVKSKKKDRKKNERKADKVYDPDKHCGVINDAGKPCVRSILCKVHQVALKRAVINRTMPYDMLIRILKNQNDEEKIKAENGSHRLLKLEPGEKLLPEVKEPPRRGESILPGIQPSALWTTDQTSIKAEEPPAKRLKIKKEAIEEDVDQNQFALPSHLEALIDETLKTLKDVDETEPLPLIPVIPKTEPLLKWNFESRLPPKSPSPPPHIFLDDIHWHSTHPKPLATNTFGCRLIGGLMSTCKKLDTLRKHLQSVWASSASSPTAIRSGFNDLYNSPTPQNANANNVNNPKTNLVFPKYAKKPPQNKAGPVVKKTAPTVLAKTSAIKRKRRSNSNVIAPIQNAHSNASDIISGLVINSVPVQRTGSSSVPTIPTGVIPVNSITGNGVPLRLFQGSLPVIASATHNQPATFIHLNLCPPK